MASDAKGVFTILGLDQGTYYLKETDSPAGYREYAGSYHYHNQANIHG